MRPDGRSEGFRAWLGVRIALRLLTRDSRFLDDLDNRVKGFRSWQFSLAFGARFCARGVTLVVGCIWWCARPVDVLRRGP